MRKLPRFGTSDRKDNRQLPGDRKGCPRDGDGHIRPSVVWKSWNLFPVLHCPVGRWRLSGRQPLLLQQLCHQLPYVQWQSEYICRHLGPLLHPYQPCQQCHQHNGEREIMVQRERTQPAFRWVLLPACHGLLWAGTSLWRSSFTHHTGKHQPAACIRRRNLRPDCSRLEKCYRNDARKDLSERLRHDRTRYKICRRSHDGTCIPFLYRTLRKNRASQRNYQRGGHLLDRWLCKQLRS